MALVECVPNFSEGRDPSVLAELVDVARSVRGTVVLDASQDPDHHRAVLTFAAEPEPAADAAFRLVRRAAERIDLRRHAGVHPRIGATDVLPFVPLRQADHEVCVALARRVARRIGEELAIPVYLYGLAARRPERAALPAIRRGGLEGLAARLAAGPQGAPDEGPARLHPTAGATAVGARQLLIAFNVLLDTEEVAVARRIAARLRESGGGLPGVRALGLPVATSRAVQVSTNVCDHRRAGLREVYDRVAELAHAEGVEVRGSELIGLAPAAALDAELARHVGLAAFDPERQLVERRIAALAGG